MVELVGEAYIQVQRDPDRPFIVKSGNTVTRALGTEFNIRAYPDEETIHISLTKGAVMVEVKTLNMNSEFHLEPGESVVFNKRANFATRTLFEPEKTIAWKDGIIYFDRADLETIINKLSRWYGVEFTIRNYHGEPWHYSGQFSNEYLEVVLQSMSYSKHFDFKITDGKVIMDFKQNETPMKE
jgi:ferric-dicitrate binding protein FerR (iron transport regulator)